MKNVNGINQWLSKISIALTAIMFWIAMNYVGWNMGGRGLQLPFNNYIWIASSFFIVVGLFRLSLFSKITLSKTYGFYLGFVALLLLPLAYTNRLFLDVEAMRLYGMGAGLLFLLILLQFNTLKFKQQLLFIVFISCVIQTIWGLVQYYFIFEPHFLFYRADLGSPYGVFQQVNDYVTYITVGSLISIYYCFTAKVTNYKVVCATALLVFCNFHLSQLSKADTASVIALVAVPLYLGYWLWKTHDFKVIALLFVVGLMGALMPRAWFDVRSSSVQQQSAESSQTSSPASPQTSLQSSSQALSQPPLQASALSSLPVSQSSPILAQNQQQVAALPEQPANKPKEKKILQGKVSKEDVLGTRETIYQVALIMIMDKPWLGHGIGTFRKQYLLYQGDYLKSNPGAPAEFNIDHPHNEIFLWVIEFGITALVAFIFLLAAWIYLLKKRQIDSQILLLASPIILHSLLELPMYHSAPHFLLFISLLFISDRSRKIRVSLPKLSKVVVLPITFYSFFQIQVFLLSTIYALDMFLRFNATNRESVQYLLQVKNPAAFKLRFEFELFQHKLRQAAKTKKISQKDLTSFIYWSYSVTQYAPIQTIYENFIEALRLIGNSEAALKYANEAVHMYPFNEKLARYQKELQSKFDAKQALTSEKVS